MTGAEGRATGALGAGWTHVEPRPPGGWFGRAARVLDGQAGPAAADLAPRGVGALLDTALDVLRARFPACFGMAFAILLPLALFSRALRHRLGEELGAMLFELGMNFLAQALVIGLITHLVYAHMQGRRTSALESLALAGRRGPALLAIALLTQFATTVGMGCCVVPGVVVSWLTAVAPAALVLEGIGPIAALSRSGKLMRGAFGRWLGVMTLQFLLVLPLTGSAGVLDEVTTRHASGVGPLVVVLETAARVGLLGLAICLTSVVLTVLYIDCRVRNEGFDLVMRFERLSARRGGRA